MPTYFLIKVSSAASATPGGILDRIIQAEESKHGALTNPKKKKLNCFLCIRSYVDCLLTKENLWIQKHTLHKYVNEDVSLGSWFLGCIP